MFPKVLVLLNCFSNANQGGIFFIYKNIIYHLYRPFSFLVKISFLSMSVCIIKVVLKYDLFHRTVISDVTLLIIILELHCALLSYESKSYDRGNFIASISKKSE